MAGAAGEAVRVRRFLAERPDDARGHHAFAALLREADDLKGAEAGLRRSLACADDSAATLALADLLCLWGRLADAAALAEQVLAKTPHDAGARYFAASVYFDLSEREAASRHARAGILLDPAAGGEAWRTLGIVDADGTALRRALAMRPDDDLARFELAVTLDREDRRAEASLQRRAAMGADDWRDLPVIINNRDRLAPMLRLLDWLRRAGHRNVIILDNQSTYPPLLRFYEQLSGPRLVRLDVNAGHVALWRAGILARLRIETPFVYTDPDIVPDEGCPLNAVEHFCRILLGHGQPLKVGFNLRIDDLPDCYRHKEMVIRWEGAQFWSPHLEIRPGQYWAPIDTTFALYPAHAPYVLPGIRTGPPYVARHLTWYSDSANPDEEEQYYRAHAVAGVTNWSAVELPVELRQKISELGRR
jgi:tetratricopeptide (TPR) repeat protein